MLNTIRAKLLLILLSFICITTIIFIVLFRNFIRNRDALTDFIFKTESINFLLMQDINTMHEFFENETINPTFFITGKSNLLASHQSKCSSIEASLKEINLKQSLNEFELNDTLSKLQLNFLNYRKTADNIINQILIRGFKDFGVEGKMRQYAHQLENYSFEIGMINVLQLRRHEKDFIIRQEDEYVKKHLNLILEIRNNIINNSKISDTKKETILLLLQDYSKEFEALVFNERKIGLRKYGGLKMEIDNNSAMIINSLSSLVQISKDKVRNAINELEIFYLIIGLMFIIISLISAIVISKKSSHAISELKNKIAQFVESDFKQRTVLPIINSENEIDTLITNVSIMEQHIVNQMEMLKQTNKDLEMLFYATSQDIRQPLIASKELVEEALNKTDDPSTLNYLEKINDSLKNLFHIIEELGIITNIRNVEIKTEFIDFQKLIKEVFFEFKSLVGFDNIILSIDTDFREGFYSSIGLLRAIFRNIIENGIKYARKGQGQNFIKIVIVDHNNEMLRIEISDNGIGIKKEHQEKIFEMFYRGTTYASGTGLGLYIVKCSMDKLNGLINVESDEEKGTMFTLLIPKNVMGKNIKEKIIQKIELIG